MNFFSLTVNIVYLKTHPFLILFVVTPHCILRFHLFKLPNYTSRRTDELFTLFRIFVSTKIVFLLSLVAAKWALVAIMALNYKY